MVKTMNMFVCALTLIFFIMGCGQDQERPTEEKESAVQESGETATKDSGGMVEKMKSQAETIKEKTYSAIGEQVERAKAVFDEEDEETITEHGDDEATKVDQASEEESAQIASMKDKTSSIVADLINKATTLFEEGKYEESIAAAQDILSNHDSDSQEAKGIITKAKEKLKELYEEQAIDKLETTTATDKAEDLKDNLTDKLKSFGQ